eukprot:2721061-Pyramimonas_sp.AAC.1
MYGNTPAAAGGDAAHVVRSVRSPPPPEGVDRTHPLREGVAHHLLHVPPPLHPPVHRRHLQRCKGEGTPPHVTTMRVRYARAAGVPPAAVAGAAAGGGAMSSPPLRLKLVHEVH